MLLGLKRRTCGLLGLVSIDIHSLRRLETRGETGACEMNVTLSFLTHSLAMQLPKMSLLRVMISSKTSQTS